MRKAIHWIERHWEVSLFIFIGLIYAPFLGFRVIRMAGDEKVYVTQALEMIRSGRWFLQTLADEPNYFKGPFHYLAIRMGYALFGYSMWATLYMNFALVAAGAWSLGALVKSKLPEWGGGAFMAGCCLALGLGVYSHAFASQMEAELVGSFALALYCLDRSSEARFHFLFWVIAGLVGTMKSPLHSVFLGVSANLFWVLQGEWKKRLAQKSTWLFVAFGVTLCCAAYAPAYFMDRENFVRAYILRENWNKSSAGDPWEWTLIPLFSFFIFPWMFQSFVSWFQGFRAFFSKKGISFTGAEKRLLSLGLSLLLPSLVFFLLHTYRFQNYNLPVVGGLVLILATLYARFRQSRLYRIAHGLSLALGLTVIGFASVLFLTFQDPWLSPGFLALNAALALTALLAAFFYWKTRKEGSTPYLIAMGMQYICFGAVLSFLGEHEMSGVRQVMASECGRGKNLTYYNLHRNDWSEWGYLNFMLGAQVVGAHRPEILRKALERGDVILIPAEQKDAFTKFLASEGKSQEGLRPWKRWRTHGKNEQGQPLAFAAWQQKRFSVLEKEAWIFIDDSCAPAGKHSS